MPKGYKRESNWPTGSVLVVNTLGLRDAGPWHVSASTDNLWDPVCGEPSNGIPFQVSKTKPELGKRCEKCEAIEKSASQAATP